MRTELFKNNEFSEVRVVTVEENEITEKTSNTIDFLIEILEQLKKVREERVELEAEIDRLLNRELLYTSAEIASELGFKSIKQFNKALVEKGVYFEVNGTWAITGEYYDFGYDSIKQYVLDNGRIIYDRQWTEAGREFLLSLFQD